MLLLFYFSSPFIRHRYNWDVEGEGHWAFIKHVGNDLGINEWSWTCFLSYFARSFSLLPFVQIRRVQALWKRVSGIFTVSWKFLHFQYFFGRSVSRNKGLVIQFECGKLALHQLIFKNKLSIGLNLEDFTMFSSYFCVSDINISIVYEWCFISMKSKMYFLYLEIVNWLYLSIVFHILKME